MIILQFQKTKGVRRVLYSTIRRKWMLIINPDSLGDRIRNVTFNLYDAFMRQLSNHKISGLFFHYDCDLI